MSRPRTAPYKRTPRPGEGRSKLPEELKRRTRPIRVGDACYDYIQEQAERAKVPMGEFLERIVFQYRDTPKIL